MNRPGICAVPAAVVGVLLLTTGCTREQAAARNPADEEPGTSNRVTVAVSKVERRDLSQSRRVAAEFRPFQEIDVHAKVAGFVKEIYVDVGSRVRKGQTLAILEVPELRDELEQMTASLRQSQQQVEQAQHEVKRAQANQRVTHLSYTRLESVMKTRPELIAQQDVDDALGKDEAAQAQAEAAQAGLAAAKEHVNAAMANRSRVQAMLGYTKITAPFDGVVTARYADTGAMLASGTSSEKQALSLIRLSENGLLRLDIPVPEQEVPLVHPGKKVTVEVPALGRTFEGTVARFAHTVDTSTRTMMTEVDVPNPTLKIVPGMYAWVSFPVQDRKNTLVVPVQAVSREGDKALAYRIGTDNKIEILPVTPGIQTGGLLEILSGLAEGDRVAVANTSQLRPGETVTPKLVEMSDARSER
jgi:RND family efflux transporter MFP subunit